MNEVETEKLESKRVIQSPLLLIIKIFGEDQLWQKVQKKI